MSKKASASFSSYDLAEPEPSALVESLRAFGYSLKTAIADLIDNSIAAKAKNIWLRFEWNGADSRITIRDDGEGMTEKSLIAAMRPGSQSPLDLRSPTDLGRFGLGLKTASFSQCRRLTVVSRVLNGRTAVRSWDLDYVKKTREWRLLKTIEPAVLKLLKESIPEHGTVVLWENMDRITGNDHPEDDKAHQRFLQAIDLTKQHLEMVFHRYLESRNEGIQNASCPNLYALA